jgi:hypothetical protein
MTTLTSLGRAVACLGLASALGLHVGCASSTRSESVSSTAEAYTEQSSGAAPVADVVAAMLDPHARVDDRTGLTQLGIRLTFDGTTGTITPNPELVAWLYPSESPPNPSAH